jgi:hypothetical protein
MADNSLRVNAEEDEDQLELTAFRKKIHIRLDDDLHRKLRLKVANEATTIQNYITNLLRKSLG